MAKKRSIFGRILRKMYVNYMYGGRDPEEKTVNGLTIDEAINLAVRSAYMKSDAYKRQQLADQIARNQEELTRRTIEQGMTWLYPRFEDKLDELLKELKKK